MNEQQMQNQLFKWHKDKRNPDGIVHVSQRYAIKRFGRKAWYDFKKHSIENGTMVEVEPHQFFSKPLDDGSKHLGKSIGYWIAAPDKPVLSATLINFDATSTEEKDYLSVHARSNLSNPLICLGDTTRGDNRIYTDYCQLSKEKRASVTIDNEPTVEVDLSNAYFIFLLGILPKTIKDYDDFAEIVYSGKIYDFFKNAGTHDDCKQVLLTMLNNPRRLYWRDPTMRKMYKYFAEMYPAIARWIRKNAKKGDKYFWRHANHTEATIRKAINAGLKKKVGYASLTSHDGFRVKEKDLPTLFAIMAKVNNERASVKISRLSNTGLLLTSSAHSLLVCCDPSTTSEIIPKNNNPFFDFGDSC